jgi:DNA-binding NtrC family response regulator
MTPGWGGWGARYRPPAFCPPVPATRGHLNALVVGGDAEWRTAIARELHRAGPVARLDFLPFDPHRQRDAFALALTGWLRDPASGAPERVIVVGTLFVDDLTGLETPLQAALLSLAQRITDRRLSPGAPTRLIGGCAEDPMIAVEEGRLLPPLYDCLDKLRVEAPPRQSLGVA